MNLSTYLLTYGAPWWLGGSNQLLKLRSHCIHHPSRDFSSSEKGKSLYSDHMIVNDVKECMLEKNYSSMLLK